jgi:hypothetical protein
MSRPELNVNLFNISWYLPRTELLLCAVAINSNVTANTISMFVEFHRKYKR